VKIMRNIALATALLVLLTCPCIAADVSGLAGVYFCHRDETQFLTLRADSTFVLRQRKKPPDKDEPFVEVNGTYILNGEILQLLIDEGKSAQGNLKGTVFTDAQGDVWEKKSTEPQNVVRPKYKPWYK
jgi:hypothetical protein